MSIGIYASLTPLPFSDKAALEFIKTFRNILTLRKNENRAGDVLNEEYAKVADYSKIPSKEKINIKISNDFSMPPVSGSSWVLKFHKNHGFHFHSFSEKEEYLSLRRLLLFADKGLTVEIYPLDFKVMKPSGPLEKFIIEGAALAEIEFDGKMVHRFRPTNGGELYAYSIHTVDINNTDNVASTQTHEVNGNEPEEIIEHLLKIPNLSSVESELFNAR